MNDEKQKFIELAIKLESLDSERQDVRQALESTMQSLGIGTYVQDEVTGLVYKIEKPKGTFMYFRDIDYKRTAKEGEKGGTVLSKKEAEEAGFVLRK